MSRILVATCLLLVCTAPVFGGAGDVEEAARLRDQSAEDWKAGKFRDAAEKLQRAAAIYERTPEQFVAELGITRRALVWNLTKAGDVEAAHAPFAALLDVYAKDASVRSDLWNAYTALYEAAKASSDLAAAQRVLGPARDRATRASVRDVASQVLHDLGSMARDRGDRETARSYYESAIDERKAAGDPLGQAWSLNNLANLDAEGDAWRKALAPLLAVQKIVVEQHQAPPMAAVATNLRSVLARIDGESEPEEALTTWLRELSAVSLGSIDPVVVPTGHLLRRELATALRATTDPTVRLRAAQSLAKRAPQHVAGPPEVRADLLLLAAAAAIENGGAKEAAGWLSTVDVGTGPAAAHLSARLLVARARSAHAAGAKPADAQKAFAAAREALSTLGDRALRLASLPLLAESARAAGLAELAGEIEKESADANRDGAPGGAGASARSGGNLERYRGLGPLDPVFEITFAEGQLVVRDVLTTAEPLRLDLTWKPRNLALHGLNLSTFGGYVVVRSLDYGRGASVAGAAGSIDFAELGAYLPVPDKGALLVHANGAVSYRP